MSICELTSGNAQSTTDLVSTGIYNPEVHHRRSIRLKSHDYAGAGLYFVTICAHRDFIHWAHGRPFSPPGAVGARPASPDPADAPARPASPDPADAPARPASPDAQRATSGATQVSPVRELIEERMRITAEKCPFMKWVESVVMPDHMHALIRMEGGHQRLGDVVGGFKAAVSRELHACIPRSRSMRIWHRNYYEAIVRTPDRARRIAEYIRMNPWRCVQQFGNGLRGMGNPALWNNLKLGVLVSRPGRRSSPRLGDRPDASAYFSGFHSLIEKEMLARLLKQKQPVIWCPAWGLDDCVRTPDVREAMEQNRMLILEMRNRDGNLAAAEDRNRFVLDHADSLWLPYVRAGGMLDRLLRKREQSRH